MVLGTSIRVSKPSAGILSISELQAYSISQPLVNLLLKKAATQSSAFPDGYPASFAVDGIAGNFSHTNPNDVAPWLKVDISDNAVEIDVIRLTNRRNCCPERMLGFSIEILNKDVVVYKSKPTTTISILYEVFPPNDEINPLGTSNFDSSTFYTNFSPFSACSASCGGGTQTRIRGVVLDSSGNTSLDATAKSLVESRVCNSNTCPATQTTPTTTVSVTDQYKDKVITYAKNNIPIVGGVIAIILLMLILLFLPSKKK